MLVEKRKKSEVNADVLKTFIDKQSYSSELNEPAWKIIHNNPRIYVWRIEKFRPVLINNLTHGDFYDGDSYIILYAHLNKSQSMAYHLYIWIGNYSTADEYGTAAYKMAELDINLFKNAAIQYREIQGYESPAFLQIFKQLTIIKGGVTSGFKAVTTDKPEPRLLHITGNKKNVRVQEISYSQDNITADDVFIIDLGDEIYIIYGKNCTKEEKFRGASVSSRIKDYRPKVKSEFIDEYTPEIPHPIISSMPTGNKEDIVKIKKEQRPLSLWRLSDTSGTMEMTQISAGRCQKSSLESNDVFVLDASCQIFVWVGKNTSKAEKFHALAYAQKYAEKVKDPKVPLSVVHEGHESEEMMILLV